MDSSPASPNPYSTPTASVGDVQLPRLAMRAGALRWCLYLHVPLIVLGMVLTALTYAHLIKIDLTQKGSVNLLIGASFGCVSYAVRLATVVLFFAWLHAAYTRATAGIADARFTPAASVGWWFVPFANLWLPLETMRHLWQLSHSGAEWRRASPPTRLAIWWFALVLSLCSTCAAFASVWMPDWMVLGRALGFLGSFLAIVATLLAARIVGEITALQRERLGID